MKYLIMKHWHRYFQFVIILFTSFSIQCSDTHKISPCVSVIPGTVNGVIIKKAGKNLVVYGDPEGRIKDADIVLFTHFRRDVIWTGLTLVQNGSRAVAPAEEKAYFTRGDSIWENFTRSRFHDYSCQTTKIGISPINVNRFVRGGEIVKWEGLDFKVLRTPGFTRGSVSYITDIDGMRIAFTGDLIYGDGKIYDLYSFQDSVKIVGGYHGYAVRLGQLISSLELILRQKPDILIPARGPVITEPVNSINKLTDRVRSLYRNYLSVTANRFLHPDRMKVLSDHVLGPSTGVTPVPYASVIQNDPPSWYMHISTSNLVFADDSSAFLIDCGTRGALEALLKMKKSGRIKSLEGIFITHYHDDHTSYINDVVKEFGCPVYSTTELKDVLENPGSFRLPCLTTDPVRDLTIVQNGYKMSWKDFTLTFHYFPGQTLYHDAVMFKKSNGESIFFIGDSFTPSGIDDYCLPNRNFLHPETGYFFCLDFLRDLPGNVLLSNQHLEMLFSFSIPQIDEMKSLLTERNDIIQDLLPWDDVNYGVDEQWFRIYPYAQTAEAGQVLTLSAKIFNHSHFARTFSIFPVLPEEFRTKPAKVTTFIEPQREGECIFRIKVPENINHGIYLFTFSIRTGDIDLHEWGETLIII